MVDNITTNLPNGQELDINSFDPFRELVKVILKQYKTNINLAQMGPHYGVVFGIDSTPLWDYPTSDEARMRRIHSAPLIPKVKIYAYVDGITLTPKPTSYLVNYTSGDTGGEEIDPGAMDSIITLPRFVAKEECMHVPHLGELVYVDWLNKPSNDTSEWTGPVYLGPVHKTRPIIVPLPTKDSPKKAFGKDGRAKGNIKKRSPYDSKYAYFSPEEVTAESLEISGLAHLAKEIYIDKELDYPDIKDFDILPGSSIIKELSTELSEKLSDFRYIQHRPRNKLFFLPPEQEIKQRKETKLFIIRESGQNYIETYKKIHTNPTMHYTISMNSTFNGSHKGLKDYSNDNKKRLCTIRVNVPYGLVINEKNTFSNNSVGCMISSPFDGRHFFRSDSTWQDNKPIKEINKSQKFSNFKERLHDWVANRRLPDNSFPFILGPFGTPGLRTGPNADQNASILDISNNNFWSGKITWSPTGHYFLPTLDQAAALYDLISSIMLTPPKSAYSWGYKKSTWHKHFLTWNFPAVAGGPGIHPTSHFLRKEGNQYNIEPGFPWGKIGPLPIEKYNKPETFWKNGLKSKGASMISGIVSYSRWGTDSSPFLEHYILARSLGFGHLESWYLTLAAAAETTPKLHKGKGHGPTKIPVFGDVSLNKHLEKGQKMWFKATSYMMEGI